MPARAWLMVAHPRMRGEHLGDTSSENLVEGSSPHARGARHRRGGARRRGGLIPACAGSTQWGITQVRSPRAHPRMRGEHQTSSQSSVTHVGSSPHARGAPLERGHDHVPEGLIPSCAGSTPSSDPRPATLSAHPRMRGEHASLWTVITWVTGSSPHARGAPPVVKAAGAGEGLIPACAGSTLDAAPVPLVAVAHPRMRGEHTTSPAAYPCGVGSSPHARGAPHLRRHRLPQGRLIPACAGSTGVPCRGRRRLPAHPRMRGEHAFE